MAAVSSIEASIEAKNVPLQFDPLIARHQGVVQLFTTPHPPQIGRRRLYRPTMDAPFLYHQQSMQIERRITEFAAHFVKLYKVELSPQSLGMILLSESDWNLNRIQSINDHRNYGHHRHRGSNDAESKVL